MDLSQSKTYFLAHFRIILQFLSRSNVPFHFGSFHYVNHFWILRSDYVAFLHPVNLLQTLFDQKTMLAPVGEV